MELKGLKRVHQCSLKIPLAQIDLFLLTEVGDGLLLNQMAVISHVELKNAH